MTQDYLAIDSNVGYREELLANPSLKDKELQGDKTPSFASPLLGLMMSSSKVKDQSKDVAETDKEMLCLENDNKKIGMLTVAERKLKVEKYWAKKHKRSWKKTIAYNSRKEMASKRLRVKGRFVSERQLLSLANLHKHKQGQQNKIQNKRKTPANDLPKLKKRAFEVHKVRKLSNSEEHSKYHIPTKKTHI